MNDLVLISPGFCSPPSHPEWKTSVIPGHLRMLGYEVEVINHCNNGWGDINHNAEKLARRIGREPWARVVHVIGHSMGGLVARLAARYYYEEFSPFGQLRSIVTIGSPHYGTNWGRLWPFGGSIKQMTTGSDFLTHLNGKGDLYPIMSIACKLDEAVRPYQNSDLKTAHKRVVLDRHTHVSVLYSKKVASKISSFLYDMEQL